MIAGRLTMLAPIERNQATGTDSWNNPVGADFQPVGTIACFAWSTMAKKVADGSKTAEIEDARALFALGADIAEHDEIPNITDRLGNVTIPGRLRVEGPVQFKHTHLEAALKRIG